MTHPILGRVMLAFEGRRCRPGSALGWVRPADTSSTVRPALAAALRGYHRDVDEVVVEPEPDAASIAAVRDRAAAADHVVIGTIDAHRMTTQQRLVEAVAATGTPTIAVAMRGPWDVAAYPPGVTALATYSILPGSLDAVAAVISGEAQPVGRLPVRLTLPVPVPVPVPA